MRQPPFCASKSTDQCRLSSLTQFTISEKYNQYAQDLSPRFAPCVLSRPLHAQKYSSMILKRSTPVENLNFSFLNSQLFFQTVSSALRAISGSFDLGSSLIPSPSHHMKEQTMNTIQVYRTCNLPSGKYQQNITKNSLQNIFPNSRKYTTFWLPFTTFIFIFAFWLSCHRVFVAVRVLLRRNSPQSVGPHPWIAFEKNLLSPWTDDDQLLWYMSGCP